MRAELRNEKYLDRYLAQKEISLDGSILLDTGGEMKYYLTQTGKGDCRAERDRYRYLLSQQLR